jgi:hypothetical protein
MGGKVILVLTVPNPLMVVVRIGAVQEYHDLQPLSAVFATFSAFLSPHLVMTQRPTFLITASLLPQKHE